MWICFRDETMNKSFNERTFCVYGYFVDDICYYIGHGCEKSKRPYVLVDKNEDVTNLLKNNKVKIVVIHNKMTKFEAEAKENEYLAAYLNVEKDSFKLLNKAGVRKVREIDPCVFSEWLRIDDKSPSGLSWIKDRGLSIKEGDVAGNRSRINGYWQVGFNNISYQAHRIVMALHTSLPVPVDMLVNHIDSDKGNNSVSNLEYVDNSENTFKSKIRKDNTTGTRGLYWTERHKCWTVVYSKNKDRVRKTFKVNFKVEGDYERAKQDALQWLGDKEERDKDIENLKFSEDGVRLPVNNTTGVIGVYFEKASKTNGCGRFRAVFYNEKKSFPVMRHGYDLAFKLACEWRKGKEEAYIQDKTYSLTS